MFNYREVEGVKPLHPKQKHDFSDVASLTHLWIIANEIFFAATSPKF